MKLARRAEVQPVIAATFPLNQAAQAQEELSRRGHVGKIVIAPLSSIRRITGGAMSGPPLLADTCEMCGSHDGVEVHHNSAPQRPDRPGAGPQARLGPDDGRPPSDLFTGAFQSRHCGGRQCMGSGLQGSDLQAVVTCRPTRAAARGNKGSALRPMASS
ncbi:zinc-binding dehydrogenase [Streptomyces rugosispiralis]|uniref:zinc-binding dehydrogenase n=1 Tax=Streptomyces rugosispiralis TaxID=2967341 RepID=UPI003704A7F6